jgi:ABC-2 type transport system permease protein
MAGSRDVVRFEVIRSLKKKAFWFTSIVPPLLILIILGISFLSNRAAKESSQQQTVDYKKTSKIAVLDESGLLNKGLLATQKISVEPNRSAGIAAAKAGQIDAFFYYPRDIARQGVFVYAQDQGISFMPAYSASAVQLLRQSIITAVGKEFSDTQAVKVLEQTPGVTAVTYKNGQQTYGLAALIVPGLFLVAFLALVILLSYSMISSTTEEKENRTAEILLTCARARTLVSGKMLSIFVLGLIQLTIIAVPLLTYYVIFQDSIGLPGNVTLSQVPLDPLRIVLGALFAIAGFVFYTTFIVGLGAMFPNANEAGRFLGIAIIWAYVPMYVIMLVITDPHSLIVTVFTYFPMTAPTTALLRNTVGTISFGEAIGVLAIVIGSAILATLFAFRSFQYGAMEYGRRLSFKELFR